MKYQRLLSGLAFAMILTGCNGANVQPGATGQEGACWY